MSAYTNIANTFSNIANAIRIRTHSTDTYTPEQLPAAINAISGPSDDYCVIVNGERRWGSICFDTLPPQASYGPITIGNHITNCHWMFGNCPNFNQPVTIPEGVTNCSSMFVECYNFNQPITVPTSVTDVVGMFDSCSNMRSVVRLPSKFNNGTVTSFWYNCPVSVQNGTLIFY